METFSGMPDFGLDVESAKQWYCGHFEHAGCGGIPKAYVQGAIVCSRCSYRQDCTGDEPLGAALENPAWKVKGRNYEPVIEIKFAQPSIFG